MDWKNAYEKLGKYIGEAEDLLEKMEERVTYLEERVKASSRIDLITIDIGNLKHTTELSKLLRNAIETNSSRNKEAKIEAFYQIASTLKLNVERCKRNIEKTEEEADCFLNIMERSLMDHLDRFIRRHSKLESLIKKIAKWQSEHPILSKIVIGGLVISGILASSIIFGLLGFGLSTVIMLGAGLVYWLVSKRAAKYSDIIGKDYWETLTNHLHAIRKGPENLENILNSIYCGYEIQKCIADCVDVDNRDCYVCLNYFEEGEEVYQPDCNYLHIVHQHCYTQLKPENRKVCSLCKEPIFSIVKVKVHLIN